MTCFLMTRRNEKGKLQTIKGEIGGGERQNGICKSLRETKTEERRSQCIRKPNSFIRSGIHPLILTHSALCILIKECATDFNFLLVWGDSSLTFENISNQPRSLWPADFCSDRLWSDGDSVIEFEPWSEIIKITCISTHPSGQKSFQKLPRLLK